MSVVRLRRKGGEIIQDCDVYIGRRITMGGWNLPDSKWRNPFPISAETGTDAERRTKVLSKYKTYILSSKRLMADLHELRGKTLGCWCKPHACHGDILLQLLE